ncbi:TonB family protein [bacterium]|nr:TonB family protein [bacterium]
MEYFSNSTEYQSRRHLFSVIISIFIHLLILGTILSVSLFSKRTLLPADVINVTLFDFSGSDIVPGNSSKTKESEKNRPSKKSSELVDPSEAELKRMKKRKNDRKLPSKTEDKETFQMRTGFLPGGSGQTMGSLKLDAKDFPFMYYLSMMKNKISENWIPPFGSVSSEESKRVVVMFRVDRSGRIFSPEVEESSDDDLLDQSALRAVIVSAPFPPLPEGYPDASLGVHFGFLCQL